jgi:hypothetical protein
MRLAPASECAARATEHARKSGEALDGLPDFSAGEPIPEPERFRFNWKLFLAHLSVRLALEPL